MIVEDRKIFETLPRFFRQLPEAMTEPLRTQLSCLFSTLSQNDKSLEDLYHSFNLRNYTTLLPVFGLENRLSYGTWPREAINALLPVMAEYTSKRGTVASIRLAIAKITGIADSSFEILERHCPRPDIKVGDLVPEAIENLDNGPRVLRSNEDSLAVTLVFRVPREQIGESKIATLDLFLRAELPLGIKHYKEFTK
jgi:hypothetical protein